MIPLISLIKALALPVLFWGASLEGTISSQDPWEGQEYALHSSSQKEAASELLRYLVFEGDESLLDVGCGDGTITAALSHQIPNGRIRGIDISTSMINFAQQSFPTSSYPNLQFRIGNAIESHGESLYDGILSFTALNWVSDHATFLKSSWTALKPSGSLAFSLPLGLPDALQQAVSEISFEPHWAPYFKGFQTGWNFGSSDSWKKLLLELPFEIHRFQVVRQHDVFPSRTVFEGFIRQWFPYLRPLPENLRSQFLNEVLDRFFSLDPTVWNTEVHFKVQRLEVIVKKI